MAQIIQNRAAKGSRHWLQELVNNNPEFLNAAIRPGLKSAPQDSITWLSPRKSDGYSEYHDESFLNLLSIRLDRRPLDTFWPSGGPHWDALGKTSRGDILLVEAKAHIGELESTCKASEQSLPLIKRSLDETGSFMKVASTSEWLHPYYQYANRLAHLHLLRHLNGIPAWLIFLYFLNAEEMSGPRTAHEWHNAIQDVHAHLGITPSQLGPYVLDVFLDVSAPEFREGKSL